MTQRLHHRRIVCRREPCPGASIFFIGSIHVALLLEVGISLTEGATTALPPTKEEIEELLAVTPGYDIGIRLPH